MRHIGLCVNKERIKQIKDEMTEKAVVHALPWRDLLIIEVAYLRERVEVLENIALKQMKVG